MFIINTNHYKNSKHNCFIFHYPLKNAEILNCILLLYAAKFDAFQNSILPLIKGAGLWGFFFQKKGLRLFHSGQAGRFQTLLSAEPGRLIPRQ